ncbi:MULTISPECIES: FecR family protein [unclassified Chitinophaga]|uniref:FecR family protein n=1 Tax=unclassified Chitinophaga TaxID=2619133 RepID=UPI0030104677
MSKDNELDWSLIHKILKGTATKKELAKWEELTRQQAAYAALIPWLRRVRAEQQDTASPFYAMDAWQDFKTKLPAKQRTLYPPNVFRLWQKAGAAAAVAGIISLCWWLYPSLKQSSTKAIALVTYTVPNGQRKLITLPDSTQIWINAGSLVKVPAEWEEDSIRQIYLEGEGFFEVRKDPARAFVVHTPEATVRVLGTSFNIEAYHQVPVAVTVATGKVQFSGKGGQSVTLAQNQRAVWIAGKEEFQTTQTDASLYNIWREGILQFRDEPLPEVIGALERRFNVPMKVIGEIGKDQYCTARFEAGESLDNILESMRHIYGLTITQKEGVILIQSRQAGK